MATVLRECPNAKVESLRFQIGEVRQRPIVVPIMEGFGKNAQVIGHKQGTEMVSVYHLLGSGSTLAIAEHEAARTQRAKPKEKTLLTI